MYKVIEVVVYLSETFENNYEVLHVDYNLTKDEAIKCVKAVYGDDWVACDVIKDGNIL